MGQEKMVKEIAMSDGREVMVTGVIGDFCDFPMLESLIAEYDKTNVIPKFFIDASSPCVPVVKWASEKGITSITMLPIDLSKIEDSKPLYDRYHQIINDSSVIVIFEGEKPRECTANAIRYVKTLGAD